MRIARTVLLPTGMAITLGARAADPFGAPDAGRDPASGRLQRLAAGRYECAEGSDSELCRTAKLTEDQS